MQIVIDMPDKMYQKILKNGYDYGIMNVIIQNGIPLPKNHGRLIDADYVINHICESKECYKENCKGKLYMRCMDIMWVDDAPTIIEAEKEGAGNESNKY